MWRKELKYFDQSNIQQAEQMIEKSGSGRRRSWNDFEVYSYREYKCNVASDHLLWLTGLQIFIIAKFLLGAYRHQRKNINKSFKLKPTHYSAIKKYKSLICRCENKICWAFWKKRVKCGGKFNSIIRQVNSSSRMAWHSTACFISCKTRFSSYLFSFLFLPHSLLRSCVFLINNHHTKMRFLCLHREKKVFFCYFFFVLLSHVLILLLLSFLGWFEMMLFFIAKITVVILI